MLVVSASFFEAILDFFITFAYLYLQLNFAELR